MSILCVWPRILPFSVSLLLLIAVRPVAAQHVQWRYNYEAARQEAKTTNRPLVMDFGTANCCWCKKLDAVTFRDAIIVRQLNEQFIPLKIDAEREPALTQKLHIESYPTLVFAAPDGRILGSHPGFLDAEQFGQQLRQLVAETTPKVPATSGREPESTSAPPGRPLLRTTAPPAEPGAIAPERSRRARELLAAAQEALRQQEYLGCLEHCTLLTDQYRDLPQAEEARKLARHIQTNPEAAQRACAKLTEQLGVLYLAQADIAINQNQNEQAVAYLERVVQICPGSRIAQTARGQLGRLSSGAAEQPQPQRAVRAQSP